VQIAVTARFGLSAAEVSSWMCIIRQEQRAPREIVSEPPGWNQEGSQHNSQSLVALGLVLWSTSVGSGLPALSGSGGATSNTSDQPTGYP
jgi:hypothetical protein